MIKIIKTKQKSNVIAQRQKDSAAVNAFLELNTWSNGYCPYEVVEADGILIEATNKFIPTMEGCAWLVSRGQYEVSLLTPIYYSYSRFVDGFIEFTDKLLLDKYIDKYQHEISDVCESDGVYHVTFKSRLFNIEKSLQTFFGDELYTRYLPLQDGSGYSL